MKSELSKRLCKNLENAYESQFTSQISCDFATQSISQVCKELLLVLLEILGKPSRLLKYTGKCSHGGIYDQSQYEHPTGGMNSESYNYTLSPHYKFHSMSAESATAHSQAFLHSGEYLFSLVQPR